MPSWLRRCYPAIDYYPRRNRRRALRSYSRYKYGRRIKRRRYSKRRGVTRVRIHKFKLRFEGHWPDWTSNEGKTFFPVVFVQGSAFDNATTYEYYKLKGLKIHFITKFLAEQPEQNTNNADTAARMWIRRLNNGIVPNDYVASDIRADQYEDSELVYMSGPKTFYSGNFGARGFMLTEPVQADPSPDSATLCRVSMSNRRYYTFADKLYFHPFMILFNTKVSDDYDFYWNAWIHCLNFVNKHPGDTPKKFIPLQESFGVKMMTLEELRNKTKIVKPECLDISDL